MKTVTHTHTTRRAMLLDIAIEYMSHVSGLAIPQWAEKCIVAVDANFITVEFIGSKPGEGQWAKMQVRS